MVAPELLCRSLDETRRGALEQSTGEIFQCDSRRGKLVEIWCHKGRGIHREVQENPCGLTSCHDKSWNPFGAGFRLFLRSSPPGRTTSEFSFCSGIYGGLVDLLDVR